MFLNIYIRGEYSWIPDILEEAIDEAKAAGFLGKNILGTGFDCEIYVQREVVELIFAVKKLLCLNSLEGKRGNPRLKPPFPAVKGLWERPTVVNNVESIAAIVLLLILQEQNMLK